MKDPIVEEVHRRREERSERFKHDLDAMFDDLRRSERQSKARGAKFVTLKPKRVRRGAATAKSRLVRKLG